MGVMMTMKAGASPCVRFKVSRAYQHLSPKRQLVTFFFFRQFAGVIGVTVAPLPSPSAVGSTRPLRAPWEDVVMGREQRGVSFPPPSLPLSLSPCPGTCRGHIEREALS